MFHFSRQVTPNIQEMFEHEDFQNVVLFMKNGKIKCNLFHLVLESQLLREVLDSDYDAIILPDYEVQIFEKAKKLISNGEVFF